MKEVLDNLKNFPVSSNLNNMYHVEDMLLLIDSRLKMMPPL
jgi:hypothetical protein